jgi:two-component system cell cycle response regulator DivK
MNGSSPQSFRLRGSFVVPCCVTPRAGGKSITIGSSATFTHEGYIGMLRPQPRVIPAGPVAPNARAKCTSSPLILIVDRDEDSRRIFGVILRANDYRTIEANNAEDAWSRLESDEVALILLEVFGIDDTPALRERIHALPSPPPVLAVTTQDERDGYDCYLRKPCTPQQLVREVRRILRDRSPRF